MASNNTHSFTLLAMFLTLLATLVSSATEHSTVASDQINFWSQNVENEMPDSIVNKLSPMSANDLNYYADLMTSNTKNDKFYADSTFCSLARLQCSPSLVTSKVRKSNAYGHADSYSIGAFKQENAENQDPFSFFRLEKLKTNGLVHLPNLKESLPERSFLPNTMASKIPLESKAISKIFPDITTAKSTKETVETSLSYCNAGAIEGEKKTCPKSLEQMIGFAKSTLGGGNNKKLISLTSKGTQGSDSEVMVRDVKRFNAERIVACHETFLPFAAYFCHSLASTRLYKVDLVDPKSLNPINTMLAICHMDTSPWPKEHVAFQILKFGPGQGEACHWFTQLDLAWI